MDHWQKTAWDGISIETPRSWTVATIGRRYLLFESGGRPVLEIKWGGKKAGAPPRKQLARWMKGHPKRVRRSFTTQSIDLPAAAADVFEGIGFTWEAENRSGEGKILHCRECGMTTMLQFLKEGKSVPVSVRERILGSYTDHFTGNAAPWQIYDIRAAVPRSFHLDAYRFQPGRFELLFSKRSDSILYQRWGPADALTANNGLPGFARRIGLAPPTETDPLQPVEHVEWSDTAAPSAKNLSGWLKRIFRPEHRRVRVWMERSCNRVLVVRMSSRKPVDENFFSEVCCAYEACR